jgi:hypothetical protein
MTVRTPTIVPMTKRERPRGRRSFVRRAGSAVKEPPPRVGRVEVSRANEGQGRGLCAGASPYPLRHDPPEELGKTFRKGDRQKNPALRETL